MKVSELLPVVCAVLIILGVFVTQSKADTWYLNESNVDLGVTGNFASVDISVSGNTATFTIDANDAILGSGNNFGIQNFFFDTKLTSITADDFLFQSGWVVVENPNGSASEFGKFELQYQGNGSSRIDPLVFQISDSNIISALDFYEANSEGHHFAAHIAGFPATGTGQWTSAFFTDGGAPVPEPGTLVLLGVGLVGLGFYGRRRMKIQG